MLLFENGVRVAFQISLPAAQNFWLANISVPSFVGCLYFVGLNVMSKTRRLTTINSLSFLFTHSVLNR